MLPACAALVSTRGASSCVVCACGHACVLCAQQERQRQQEAGRQVGCALHWLVKSHTHHRNELTTQRREESAERGEMRRRRAGWGAEEEEERRDRSEARAAEGRLMSEEEKPSSDTLSTCCAPKMLKSSGRACCVYPFMSTSTCTPSVAMASAASARLSPSRSTNRSAFWWSKRRMRSPAAVSLGEWSEKHTTRN